MTSPEFHHPYHNSSLTHFMTVTNTSCSSFLLSVPLRHSSYTFLSYFLFKVLLNLLRRHCLIKLYRFQVYDSITHHLYILLCVPHPQKSYHLASMHLKCKSLLIWPLYPGLSLFIQQRDMPSFRTEKEQKTPFEPFWVLSRTVFLQSYLSKLGISQI